MRNDSFPGYFWEVKPVTKNILKEDFEFVLVETKAFNSKKADTTSFSSYFSTNEKVVAFLNLGKDAKLIVPTPIIDRSSYTHLAKFTDKAPTDQQVAFWRKVGFEYEESIGASPKWLSTSGLGVYWLHVRIDSFPKYYQHRPYKQSQH